MRTSALSAILFLCLSTWSAVAADPVPTPAPPELPPTILNPQWGRVGRYAPWQNYSVDRFGRWRPRVVYTPDGAFYTIDGRLFPWTTQHPLEFMPYAGD